MGDRWLVRDLSFSLSKGEFIAVVGTSGSGKTSLLRKINQDFEEQSNTIQIDVISKLPIGMIYQDLELAEGATALNNALSGCLHRHTWNKTLLNFPIEEKKNAMELLRQLGLSTKINQWTSTLSRGERQRLAIIRTLLADPQIILADEPVASLDTDWANQTLGLLKQYAEQKEFGIICALHDHKQVDQFADKVIHLESSDESSCFIEDLNK